ncbi:S8 family serine peptidase [bacterium]|nr:S8 family serine peptidase [bacterium]
MQRARLAIAALALVLAGCAAAPSITGAGGEASRISGQAIAGEHIIRLKAGVSPSAYARKHGLQLVQALGLGMHLFRGERALSILEADPEVVFAEPNRTIQLPALKAQPAPNPSTRAASPNDPLFPAQYAPVITGAEKVWPKQKGSAEVIVAVIDSGIDGTHPEFEGRLLPGYDFSEKQAVAGGDRDGYGHGTHVAGVIGARQDNGVGVTGIAPGCKLLPVRIFNNSGHTTDGASTAAIIWAVDHGAKVINASWGSPSDSEAGRAAIKYAQDKDVVVVAAVGNTGKEWDPSYPAAWPGVVAVAASNDQDGWASFSTWGDWITLAGPGDAILSTYPLSKGNGYRIMSGTSMAAPAVSAVAALVRSQHPQLSQAQVIERLYATARDTVMTGKDKYVGHGRVDALRAVLDPL